MEETTKNIKIPEMPDCSKRTRDKGAVCNFQVNKTLGIDIEPEDRSVGIFSNFFSLGVKTDKEDELILNFYDEQFDEFLDEIEPHIDERRSRIKMEEDYVKGMEERY